jgi:hypothetical protein
MKQQDVRHWLEGLDVNLDQASEIALLLIGIRMRCCSDSGCDAFPYAAGV